jgi:4-amino-4-deoxy-L-arabinose transferase-like glycosyltransferase
MTVERQPGTRAATDPDSEAIGQMEPPAEQPALAEPRAERAGPWPPHQTGRRRPRVPALVLVVTALHIALMAMCTVLYPASTGPDETAHVDLAYAYSNGHGPYPPGGRLIARGVDVAVGSLRVPPSKTRPYADTPVLPRGERPSIDAAGGEAPPLRYKIPNQMVQHPPLYYLVEAGVLRLPGVDRLPYDRQVALLRWLSVLMIAPLPLLAWATAHRLVGDGPVALTAAVLPVTLPGLSRMGAMVNNDNLLTLLVAVLMLLLARVVTGDLRVRTAALVGLVLGLAMLTKGLALVLPVPVAAVYLVAWLRHRQRPLVSLATVAVVSAAAGGWWWVRNLILLGVVQPSGVGAVWERRILGNPRPGGTWLGFVPKFFRRFNSRFWGGIGYLEPPTLPHWLTTGWLATTVACALVGIAFGIGGRWGRAATAAFLFPAFAFTALIFYGAGRQYVYNLRLPGIQGRYVYPALTAMVVLFAIGVVRLAGRLARALPLVLLAAGLVTQAWAWRLLITAWWVPRSSLGDRTRMARGALGAILRWSPWPTALTLAAFIAVMVLSLAALAAAALAIRSPQPPGQHRTQVAALSFSGHP